MILEHIPRQQLPQCDYCDDEAAWLLQRITEKRFKPKLMACNRHRRQAARTLRRPSGHVGTAHRITQKTLYAF